MCREFVGNIEISRFLSGINLNLGPKMREFGRFSSGHTAQFSVQCDQTGRNPAHLGGFQHFWAGKFFDGAVGGLGGLLHKMRKWRNFFTKIAQIFRWGGQFGRNSDFYGRFCWKTSGHTGWCCPVNKNSKQKSNSLKVFKVKKSEKWCFLNQIVKISSFFGSQCAVRFVSFDFCFALR